MKTRSHGACISKLDALHDLIRFETIKYFCELSQNHNSALLCLHLPWLFYFKVKTSPR